MADYLSDDVQSIVDSAVIKYANVSVVDTAKLLFVRVHF